MSASNKNILLVVSDQHSPYKLGCYGNQVVKTPHMDTLAGQSFLFENAYCNSPLCVPSRLSMFTGKYPWKIGAWDLLSQPPADETSLPSLLNAGGYRTAAIGKMHFVGDEQLWGFEERPYGDFVGGSHQPDPIDVAPKLTFQPAGPADIPESEMQESIVTRLSVDFLKTHMDERPFFLVASYNKPHFPLRPPAHFWDMYDPATLTLPDLGPNFPDRLHPWMQRHREFHGVTDWTEDDTRHAIAGYYGCISFVDAQIGRLVQALDDTGRADDTLVIYVSDHGEMCGEHGMWGKSCFYEASVRVPLIIRHPDHPRSEAAHIRDIVELVDLFPTIAALAGDDTNHQIDGESLLPLVDSESKPARHKKHAISELYGHSAIGPMRMLRMDEWKYIQYLDAKPSMFNLRDDPHEYHDCIDDTNANTLAQDFEIFLRSDWDEAVARENFRFLGNRGGMKSPRKLHVPNQYRTQEGTYTDAETFYPDVYPSSQIRMKGK